MQRCILPVLKQLHPVPTLATGCRWRHQRPERLYLEASPIISLIWPRLSLGMCPRVGSYWRCNVSQQAPVMAHALPYHTV